MNAQIQGDLVTLRGRVGIIEKATEVLRRFSDHEPLEVLLGDSGDAADVLAVNKREGRKREHVWKPPPSGGDASTVAYTPADGTDWDAPVPAFVAPALDQLADRVNSVEDWDADDIGYTPTDPSDWSPAPTEVEGALDQLADRMHAAETSISSHTVTLLDHEGRISQNEADIADHESRISTLEGRRKSIGIEIPTPSAGTYYVLMHFPTGTDGTIERLLGKTPDSSGDTCDVRLYKRSEFNYDVATGQTQLTSAALQLDDNGAETSSFSVTSISEKEVLVVKIDATSGSPAWAWIQVEYVES